jgi:hypothetical protein
MINRAIVNANSPAVLLFRVAKMDGTLIKQADVASISVATYDTQSQAIVGTAFTPSVNTSVFDTLQTDSRWNADAVGYNVAIAMPATAWPAQGRYQVEVKITPAAGSIFYLVTQIQAEKLFST